MAPSGSDKALSSWVTLWRELKKRTVEPFWHASFVMYFLVAVAVVLVGGAGVWFEMHTYVLYVPTTEHPVPSAAAL